MKPWPSFYFILSKAIRQREEAEQELHQNWWIPDSRASVLALKRRGSFEMQMAKPVECHLCEALFKRRITTCIGSRGTLLMTALLWLISYWEQGIHPFVWATSPLSSHQWDPCSPFPHHQHTPLLTSCLDLELLFKGTLSPLSTRRHSSHCTRSS